MGDEAEALDDMMECGGWPFLASLRRQLFQATPRKKKKKMNRKQKQVLADKLNLTIKLKTPYRGLK